MDQEIPQDRTNIEVRELQYKPGKEEPMVELQPKALHFRVEVTAIPK